MALVFKLDDGVKWRIGPRYEATVGFMVTPVGNDRLTETDLGLGDFDERAAIFAALIESPEAIVAVQQDLGFRIDQVATLLSENAPAVTLTVTAAGGDEAVEAALGLVDWLEDRLQRPIRIFDTPTSTTATTLPDTSAPFDSKVALTVAPSVVAGYGDMSFDVSVGGNTQSIGLLALDGDVTVELPMTLAPTMVLQVTLLSQQAEQLSRVRLFVPPPPDFGSQVPALALNVAPGAVVPNVDGLLVLDPNTLSVEWFAGESVTTPQVVSSRDLTVMVITEDPSPVPIGQRRGPIILVAALMVGAILLLAVAVSRDNWRQLRRAYEMPMEAAPSPLKRLERSEAAEV
jgi:hypothetical protein